jgi:WD40 repeat protein
MNSQLRRRYTLRRGSAWCHEWQPHRPDFVSIGTETCALLVNVETNQTTKIFTAKSDVFYQQFDRAGRTLLNGTRDGKIKTYDVRKPPGSIPSSGSHAEIMQHKQSISCMYLMKDENKLISSSTDGMICVWERRMCRSLQTMKFPNKFSLFRFAVDPSEKYLTAASADRIMRIWDLSFHSTEDETRPTAQWALPTSSPPNESCSSAIACCSDWMTMDGSRIYDPRVVIMDGASIATAPLIPKS